MPIHDWTRVDAGVFHGFHLSWIAEIKKVLNTGLLPLEYYADAEQYTDGKNADVLALHRSPGDSFAPLPHPLAPATDDLTLPTATAHRTARKPKKPKPKQRRVVVRHVSGHRVIAHIEIVSPGNKDRRANALDFVAKGRIAIDGGIHLVVIDLFPPTRSAPRGLSPGIWRKYDPTPVPAPSGQPLSLASFLSAENPEAYFKWLSFTDELPKFPLFLTDTHSINLPLADTYTATFAASPPYLRELLSQPASTGA